MVWGRIFIFFLRLKVVQLEGGPQLEGRAPLRFAKLVLLDVAAVLEDQLRLLWRRSRPVPNLREVLKIVFVVDLRENLRRSPPPALCGGLFYRLLLSGVRGEGEGSVDLLD